MREFSWVLIITGILLAGGLVTLYFSNSDIGGKFNFYRSELTINGFNVTETLHFRPGQEYHTLFRTFVDPAYPQLPEDEQYRGNYEEIVSVECSNGNNYLRDYTGECINDSGVIPCKDYTEDNEYGCTFGQVYGFQKGQDYTITSDYIMHYQNLFLIRGNYYFKFVAYSPDNHNNLDSTNFVVNGNVVKNKKYNKLLGFIGFDNKNRYLVFKVKDTMAKRNTGARCDESAKSKKILLLNEILGEEKYTKENTKGIVQSEMCSTQEFILRHYNKERKNGQIWFLDYESTMLHGL